MIVLSFPADTARRIVEGEQTVVTYPGSRRDFFALVVQAGLCRHCGKAADPDGDHSCPCPYPRNACPNHPDPVVADPTYLVGQPVAVARQGWSVRTICCGREDTTYRATSWDDAEAFRQSYIDPGTGHDRQGIIDGGAIVGSATVAAVVPVYDESDRAEPGVIVRDGRLFHATGKDKDWYDVTDQLPLADFTPGRWALILADAAPCEQQCVACLASNRPGGSVNHGRPPIPYDHPGPISEWSPK